MSIVTLAAINTLLFLRTVRALRSLRVVAFSPLLFLFFLSLSLSLFYTPSFSFYLNSLTFDLALSSHEISPANVTKIAA